MANFAQVILAGHLTKNAEVAFTSQQTAITRFDVAVNTGWGEKKEANFYKCAMFGDRGQKLAQYLTKGKLVLVTGEPTLRKTTRDDGRFFADIQVRVAEVQLMSGNEAKPTAPAQPDNTQPENDEIPF